MCVYPYFFELNQNGHNSVNLEARTSKFFMVVDLEEEDNDNKDNNDEDDNNEKEDNKDHNIFASKR